MTINIYLDEDTYLLPMIFMGMFSVVKTNYMRRKKGIKASTKEIQQQHEDGVTRQNFSSTTIAYALDACFVKMEKIE